MEKEDIAKSWRTGRTNPLGSSFSHSEMSWSSKVLSIRNSEWIGAVGAQSLQSHPTNTEVPCTYHVWILLVLQYMETEVNSSLLQYESYTDTRSWDWLGIKKFHEPTKKAKCSLGEHASEQYCHFWGTVYGLNSNLEIKMYTSWSLIKTCFFLVRKRAFIIVGPHQQSALDRSHLY